MILTLFAVPTRFERNLSFSFFPYYWESQCVSLVISLQVVENGYDFFADRQLVNIFSAPNYCGEFDNAGALMSVDETLMCSFQILNPSEKKPKFGFGSTTTTKTKVYHPSPKTSVCPSCSVYVYWILEHIYFVYNWLDIIGLKHRLHILFSKRSETRVY